MVSVKVTLNGCAKAVLCYVANTKQSLFGIDAIESFGLWSQAPVNYCLPATSPPDSCLVNLNQDLPTDEIISTLREDFAGVFEPSLGKCNITTACLNLRDKKTTVFRPKRDVPFASKIKVEEELDRMESLGIISPVTYSTFAAPIVVVQKPNGKIRICADYCSGLNDALFPHEYPIPTPDSIISRLSTCTIFSRIDLSNAYLQIPVDDEAKMLLTIITHKGLYNFNRLCPGVQPASGIFQQTMDKMLQEIDEAVPYFDDILIATKDKHSHAAVLRIVFERLQECNVRARVEKCSFFQEELQLLGMNVNQHGIRPDPEKIAAVLNMPEPTNASEFKSFLGAV